MIWMDNTTGHPRMGLIVPKFQSSAVARNRLRRRLREIWRREVQAHQPAGIWWSGPGARPTARLRALRAQILAWRRARAEGRVSHADLRAVPRRLLAALIRGYQIVLSPLLPPSCRFHPSCSQYALEAVTRHGALKGPGWRRGGWPAAIRSIRADSIPFPDLVT